MTTFRPTDLPTLKYLLNQKPEPIKQAGLHPTPEQIELYAYHLPNSSLSSLLVNIHSTCETFEYLKNKRLIQLIKLTLAQKVTEM